MLGGMLVLRRRAFLTRGSRSQTTAASRSPYGHTTVEQHTIARFLHLGSRPVRWLQVCGRLFWQGLLPHLGVDRFLPEALAEVGVVVVGSCLLLEPSAHHRGYGGRLRNPGPALEVREKVRRNGRCKRWAW